MRPIYMVHSSSNGPFRISLDRPVGPVQSDLPDRRPKSGGGLSGALRRRDTTGQWAVSKGSDMVVYNVISTSMKEGNKRGSKRGGK